MNSKFHHEKQFHFQISQLYHNFVDQNLILLRNLEQFISMEYPVLIGASRKRFIGSVINESDTSNRIFGMAAIASRCVIAGVDFLRVHDIKEICQVIKMTKSII